MEQYQIEMLASLYGVAMTVSGQNPHHPAYDRLLTPGERGAAMAQLNQIAEWMDRGIWPGDQAIESVNQALVRLHHEIFERWQYRLGNDGNGGTRRTT